MTEVSLNNCEAFFSISNGNLEFQETLSDLSCKYSYKQEFLFAFVKMKPLDSHVEKYVLSRKPPIGFLIGGIHFKDFFFFYSNY